MKFKVIIICFIGFAYVDFSGAASIEFETGSTVYDYSFGEPSSSTCDITSCPNHFDFDPSRCECIPLLCAIDCPPGYLNFGCACFLDPSSVELSSSPEVSPTEIVPNSAC